MINRCLVAASLFGALGTTVHAQYLMIPDSTADRIMLFNASDGSPVNLDFILDAGGTTFDFTTPKDVQQVGNEIWVTDQVSDIVVRFTASLTPQHIATVTGNMNNIRGMGQIGNTVYVSNSDAGAGPGDAVVMYSTDGTHQGFFAAPDPFDCTEFNGQLLVADIAGDDINIYDPLGNFVSVFHASDGASGIDFPEQLIVLNTGPGGAQEVWATGFTAPAGIYRYDAAGNQVAYYPVSTGPRGIAPLGNGAMMYTEGTAVMSFVPGSTDGPVVILSGGITPQFIGALTLTSGPICDSIDFNNDGLFPDTLDIDDFLSVFSGGPCTNSPNCGDIDFNNDGLFPDTLDIDALLSVFSGGSCIG
ncbi:MAG TPA: hypothetical protein VHN77_09835 [Phycisphaerales bacterium]|nr:hypothetical protein [Phycisphaerales bacterium]